MNEKTLATKRIYTGRILDLDVLDVELDNGVKSIREIVRHKGAVGVLALTQDDNVVLVRQFRKPLNRTFLEVVAGLFDPGETAEECARRELREESGFEADKIVHMGTICASPGYTDEQIDIFFARVSGVAGEQQPDEDERVEVVCLPIAEVQALIEKSEIQDAKTLAAWLLCEKIIRPNGGVVS